MVQVMWETPFMVGGIILMDKIADLGGFDESIAESLIGVFGLVTGICWEQCFKSATSSISAGWSGHYTKVGISTGLSLGLVAVLLPGWLKFIIPKARLPIPPRDEALKTWSKKSLAASLAAQPIEDDEKETEQKVSGSH